MASTLSGRSSVEQDEEVVRRARQTPRTPVKMSNHRNSITSTQRRRGLFQPASPASSESSDSLGHMSPLSSSSESLHSFPSPSFSPNGDCYYNTPVKTAPRTIAVRSSLFSKLRRSPRTPQTVHVSPSIRQTMAALQDIVGDTESTSSQITPRSSRRMRAFIAETETSPSSVGTPPSQRKPKNFICNIIPASPASVTPTLKTVAETDFYNVKSDKPALNSVPPENFYAPSLLKPVSPENFYAPAAPRSSFLIDSLGSRSRKFHFENAKRNFVSGAVKRPRSTSRSTSRSGKRHKGVIPGVWHGVKKPKKMKKNAPKPKPAFSPGSRVETIKQQPMKRLRRGKRVFEEKMHHRVAGGKNENEIGGIIDTFPTTLIKRKKLPTTPVKEPEPDPSKKFLKHGAYRKATFQLNNIQLEFKHGHVRMKTPEKRRPIRIRKVIKPQLDPVDFSLPEPETQDIQKNVDNILQQLIENDECVAPKHGYVQVDKISDEQLMNILDSPSTKIALVDVSPSKMMTEVQSSPQRTLLNNMSNLALNDKQASGFGSLALDTTGGLLSAASNVLNAEGYAYEQENAENEGGPKVYPVFDPKTWKSVSNTALTDVSNGQNKLRRKMPLVADDQYMLDAGQKSVGVVCCKECGVIYQAGDYLDEVAHNNVHNHISELSFLGWKEERVVSSFSDGRIIMVSATDPLSWQKKAKKVVGVVDLELGFSENTLTWTPDKKILLFVCEKLKQVCGCLVAELCKAGYRMYPAIEGVEVDTCAEESTPCKVGVSRIWTSVHRRRRRVATRLFEALLRISGDLTPDDVAFSIPSPDGKLLARSLVGREDFKVYGFLSR